MFLRAREVCRGLDLGCGRGDVVVRSGVGVVVGVRDDRSSAVNAVTLWLSHQQQKLTHNIHEIRHSESHGVPSTSASLVDNKNKKKGV